MTNPKQFILPYPYAQFSQVNRFWQTFDSYKNKIYGWVRENTINKSRAEFKNIMSLLETSSTNNVIKDSILENLGKIRYIYDFSGLEFGVQIDEREEKLIFRYPCPLDEDRVLYPNYNSKEFEKISAVQKLEWMYTYCEFVPFRVIREDFTDRHISHKFSHLLEDPYSMQLLDDYLRKTKYMPRKDIFYYVRCDRHGNYYLKRDLAMSPKHEKGC